MHFRQLLNFGFHFGGTVGAAEIFQDIDTLFDAIVRHFTGAVCQTFAANVTILLVWVAKLALTVIRVPRCVVVFMFVVMSAATFVLIMVVFMFMFVFVFVFVVMSAAAFVLIMVVFVFMLMVVPAATSIFMFIFINIIVNIVVFKFEHFLAPLHKNGRTELKSQSWLNI
jgi:hypothetical protein